MAEEPQANPLITSAADAAKLVKREVVVPPKTEKDEPTTKLVEIKPEEVFDFKDLGDRVVVVTVDGQKFYGDKK